MDRPTKQNPGFNPFSRETGWVIRSDLVEVVRAYVHEPYPTCTFQKTYKKFGHVNLEPFAKYESRILARLDDDGVSPVAKYHTLHGAATGAALRVTSYDVGPSLASWLDLDYAGPNDEPFAHPLSSPKALVQILHRTLLALEQLHEKGYVHGDVHAGNVCMSVIPLDERNLVRAVPDMVTLIDFGYSFKRGNEFKLPAALPIQPTPTLHSPRFMAALDADFRRGDNQATEVLRLDGRIDLHAMGLMGRVLHGALEPLWGTADNALRQRAEDLVQRLLRDLLAQDAYPGVPMPQGLHQQLALPLAHWLEDAGEWQPFSFRARGLKSVAQFAVRDAFDPAEQPPMRPPAPPVHAPPPAAQPSPSTSTQQAGQQPVVVQPPRATPPRLATPAPQVIGQSPGQVHAIAPEQLPTPKPARTPAAPAPGAPGSAAPDAVPGPVTAVKAPAWRSLTARQWTGLAIVLAVVALAIAAALLRDRWWPAVAAPGVQPGPAIQIQEPSVTDSEFCKFKPEDPRCSKK